MKKKMSFGAIVCALFVLGAVALNGCGSDSSSESTGKVNFSAKKA